MGEERCQKVYGKTYQGQREEGQKEKGRSKRLNSTCSSQAMEENDVPVRMSCIRTKDQRSQCCGG